MLGPPKCTNWSSAFVIVRYDNAIPPANRYNIIWKRVKLNSIYNNLCPFRLESWYNESRHENHFSKAARVSTQW